MKDILGYEGLYAITSCGKVWSYKSKKFLKPQRKENGYLQVSLCKDGKQNSYLIHRLVAEAYLLNPNNLPCVNHKDENRENNALQNLEWCTQSYNNNYRNRNQKIAKNQSKPVFCEELNRTFESGTAAARELNLNQGSITQCCKGKRKTTGGYHFRYQEVDSNAKTQTD